MALHLDASYFWGASRFQFPQWLLVAMVFSNLFQDQFIDQVQVVGYLHDRIPKESDGGDFVYYPDNLGFRSVPSMPRSGSVVDGSKVVHAATIYRPDFVPGIPNIDKDKDTTLRYDGDEMWSLLADEETIQKYNSTDLRISVVYRARCFADAEEVSRYYNILQGKEKLPVCPLDDHQSSKLVCQHTLDTILHKFKIDLVKRKLVSEIALSTMSKFDLAMLIMDTYIAYPFPSESRVIVPYNYCALASMAPQIARPFFRLLCN